MDAFENQIIFSSLKTVEDEDVSCVADPAGLKILPKSTGVEVRGETSENNH